MAFDIILVTDTAQYPIWTRGYGAHRIATHLRNFGYKVLVIDFASALTFDTWKTICQYAVTESTKMLGFSTTWWPYRDKENDRPVTELKKFKIKPEVLEKNNDFIKDFTSGNSIPWINIAKEKSPDIKIVVGGPKIDFYRDIPADYFISGLGETQIIDVLTDRKRIWSKVINHDTEAKGNGWTWNDSKTSYTDLDFIKPGEFLTLETSRGCRFKCAFCSYPLIGKKDMMSFMKSKDTLYSELMENYERWGSTDYQIADDTFNDSTEKLEYLLDVFRKLPFKLRLRGYVRIDVIAVHPQQMQMLKELGMTYAWIGIDSFHPEAAKIIGKGMDADKRKNALIELRKCWGDDPEIVTSYIVGLPKEHSKDVIESYNWLSAEDSPVDHAEFIPLRLLPPGPLPNVNRSTIDLNYKKFGYDIPNIAKFWEWTKKDDTDILNFNTANELADKLNSDFLTRLKNRKPNLIQFTRIQDPKVEYFDQLIYKLKYET